MDIVLEVLQRLDRLESEVTDWEADFLDACLARVHMHAPQWSLKQRAVLARMCERYLGAEGVRLAAKLQGHQQRC